MGINSTKKSHIIAKTIVDDLFTSVPAGNSIPVSWKQMICPIFSVVQETGPFFKVKTVHGEGASKVEVQLIKQC